MDAFARNKSRKPRRVNVSLASAFAINCTASGGWFDR